MRKEDGYINRPKLAEIVFGNRSDLIKLNSIVWPDIEAESKRAILHLQDLGHQIVVMEAAILIEASWHTFMDEVWLVSCPYEIGLDRLMQRGLSLQAAKARLDSQMKDSDRRKYADFIIDTNTLSKDDNEVLILEQIKQIEKRKRSSPSSLLEDKAFLYL